MLRKNFEEKRTFPKIEKLIFDFLMDCRKFAPSTLETYRKTLRLFERDMLPVDKIDGITLEHLEFWYHFKLKRVKKTTRNMYLAVIKSFYNWLNDKYGIKNLPKYIQFCQDVNKEHRVLKRSEYDKICFADLPVFRLDCFKFLCNTGLRAAEILSLHRENVHNNLLHVVGKGRKQRTIPLNHTAAEVYKRNPDFDFLHHRNYTWLYRECKHIAETTNIKPFSPHSCRHYFSNELYEKGVDIHTISRLLGHSSVIVTETVYIEWNQNKLKGITDVLD